MYYPQVNVFGRGVGVSRDKHSTKSLSEFKRMTQINWTLIVKVIRRKRESQYLRRTGSPIVGYRRDRKKIDDTKYQTVKI